MSEKLTPERHIAPQKKSEDTGLDGLIRPQHLHEFIGQESLKNNLSILIEAAKARKEPLDHILFHGPPGLGKCIVGDSLVITNKGIQELNRFIPPGLQPGQYAPCQINIYGRNGIETTSHVYKNGLSSTLRLKTRSGFELEGTPNHPLLVEGPNGPYWKPLSEITQEDFVAIARGTELWGTPQRITFQPVYMNGKVRQADSEQRVKAIYRELVTILNRPPTTPELAYAYAGTETRNPTPYLIAKRLHLPLSNGRKFPKHRVTQLPKPPITPIKWSVPEFLDADLAYLMGLLVGDGNFVKGQNAPAFVITASESEIQQEVIRICQEKFLWEPKVHTYENRAPNIRFGQNFGHLMIHLGVPSVLAGDKRIPTSILASPANVVCGFLQGLFDADGHAWPEGYVDWSSKSQTLAKQVQLVLANFGIIAHRTAKIVNGTTYWQLFIGGEDAVTYYEKVGFHKLFDHAKRGDRVFSRSQIEKYLGLLPNKVLDMPAANILKELTNPHYYWDKVISIEPGQAEVFDFCVPGTNSFVANGFFNHNTSLAHVIANEMNVNIRVTAGPAIERAGDLAAILTNMRAFDILFIDEVHRLGRAVEEILYPAMEDFVLDIIVGKGPGAKNVRLKLPKFTVIGATTRLALLTAPLRARFGAVYRMDFYDQAAVETIVIRGAGILRVPIESEGAAEIARRSRGTPRVALRLLRRVRDYVQVRAEGRITGETAVAALNLLEIDPLGLDDLDRRVLRSIIEKFGGGPVGLETIAASISEESDTIMDVVEPYLLQLGFLERTARGRVATAHAYKHLGATKAGEVPPVQPTLL